ncbi:heavy metal-binding domain-containing protein [Hymenobacter volaticus]|uniref:heavy metal-binding domain-containing protein n=1 Tax=Hymenobacter volaticus TaxID=2932254 RepID=UPI001FD69A80|nr:heavy metal-binding domain-containing protein [Hymenobacter volaticus]
MKGFSWTRAAIAVLLTAGTGLSMGCESKPATSATAPAADGTGAAPAVAAAYICPMGCEGSASNEPGKCPVCDMALEPNPDHKPAAQ